MEGCKFNGSKYMTNGIHELLPAVIVMYLWGLIEERKEVDLPMDYLQVFELTMEIRDDKHVLIIKHTQEVPPYEKMYEVEYYTPITGKVFVIDDRDHVTMLFSHEY